MIFVYYESSNLSKKTIIKLYNWLAFMEKRNLRFDVILPLFECTCKWMCFTSYIIIYKKIIISFVWLSVLTRQKQSWSTSIMSSTVLHPLDLIWSDKSHNKWAPIDPLHQLLSMECDTWQIFTETSSSSMISWIIQLIHYKKGWFGFQKQLEGSSKKVDFRFQSSLWQVFV